MAVKSTSEKSVLEMNEEIVRCFDRWRLQFDLAKSGLFSELGTVDVGLEHSN